MAFALNYHSLSCVCQRCLRHDEDFATHPGVKWMIVITPLGGTYD